MDVEVGFGALTTPCWERAARGTSMTAHEMIWQAQLRTQRVYLAHLARCRAVVQQSADAPGHPTASPEIRTASRRTRTLMPRRSKPTILRARQRRPWIRSLLLTGATTLSRSVLALAEIQGCRAAFPSSTRRRARRVQSRSAEFDAYPRDSAFRSYRCE